MSGWPWWTTNQPIEDRRQLDVGWRGSMGQMQGPCYVSYKLPPVSIWFNSRWDWYSFDVSAMSLDLKHFEVRCQIVIIKYRPSLLFLIGQLHQLFPLCQTYIMYRPSGYSQFKQWFRQGCSLLLQILRPLLLKPVVKGIVLIVFAGVFVVSIISIQHIQLGLGTFVFF